MAWSLFKDPPVRNIFALSYSMQDCKDKKCPLSRTRHPDYRQMFEDHVTLKATSTKPSKLVYASFGSGLLLQDARILEQITKQCKTLQQVTVHLIDALYTPPSENDIVEDDHRIHHAALDFATRMRSLSTPSLTIRVFAHPSVASYLSLCNANADQKADLLVLADCGPEVQKSFLLLTERALKPTGRWFVLFKYGDGSKEEILDKNLPTLLAGMMQSRGPMQHCSIIAGRQDVNRRPKIFDLSNLPRDPHLWIQFIAYPESQQKWEHRNLHNCKLSMLVYEFKAYDYKLKYGTPPPRSPLALACLFKQRVVLRRLIKYAGAKASDVVDKVTPLHWVVQNAARPDTVEAAMLEMLLKTPGVAVDAPAVGCGLIGCKCTISASTPLHWAALNSAELSCAKLIAAGANVNALNDSLTSALHIACLLQNVSLARLLVSLGARTDLKDKDGDTPLALAQRKQNAELITLLTPTEKSP